MPSLLSGYTYNENTQRYRSLSSGRFVARQQITGLLDQHVHAKEQLLTNLTNDLTAGRISPATYVAQVRQELKTLYLQNAALGAGGWDRLSAKDFGRVGGTIRDEYRRMATLAQEVADGKASAAQALNRVNMYLGNARSQFFAAERDRIQPSAPDMVVIERRVLGAAEHCADCVAYDQMGWQRAGELPLVGDSQCDGNCRCSVERREVPLSELDQWLGTKR